VDRVHSDGHRAYFVAANKTVTITLSGGMDGKLASALRNAVKGFDDVAKAAKKVGPEVSKGADVANNAFRGMQSAITGVIGKLAAVVTVASLAAKAMKALNQGMKEYKNTERAVMNTKTALSSNPAYAKLTDNHRKEIEQQMRDMAERNRAKTFSGNTINELYSNMARYGGKNPASLADMDKASPAFRDLLVKNAKGQQLTMEQSAELGKAWAEAVNTGKLKSMSGLMGKFTQAELDAFQGTKKKKGMSNAKRHQFLIDKANEFAKGSADEFAGTHEGRQMAAGVTETTALGKLGKAMTEVETRFAEFKSKVVDAIVPVLQPIFDGLATGFGKAADAAENFIKNFNINKIFGDADSQAALKSISDSFDSIKGSFSEMFKDVDWKAVADGVGRFVAAFAKDTLKEAADAIKIIAAGVKAIQGVVDEQKKTDDPFYFKEMAAPFQAIGKYLDDLSSEEKSAKFRATWMQTWQDVGDAWNTFVGTPLDKALNPESSKQAAEQFSEQMSDPKIMQGLIANAQEAGNAIGDAISRFSSQDYNDKLNAKFLASIDKFGQDMQTMWGGVLDFIQEGWNMAGNDIFITIADLGDVWNGVKDGAVLCWEGIKTAAQTVGDYIKGGLTDAAKVFEGVIRAISGLFGTIATAAANAASALSNVSLPSMPGPGTSSRDKALAAGEAAANAAKKATGGITNGAQYALIGESGPEAIIPLNDRNRAHGLLARASAITGYRQGGGNTITNNITVQGGQTNAETAGALVSAMDRWWSDKGFNADQGLTESYA
jgi:hypothetical protein